MAKFFQFQKLVDEIAIDSFDHVWKVVLFFSFDMQQGRMGEGEVTFRF